MIVDSARLKQRYHIPWNLINYKVYRLIAKFSNTRYITPHWISLIRHDSPQALTEGQGPPWPILSTLRVNRLQFALVIQYLSFKEQFPSIT